MNKLIIRLAGIFNVTISLIMLSILLPEDKVLTWGEFTLVALTLVVGLGLVLMDCDEK